MATPRCQRILAANEKRPNQITSRFSGTNSLGAIITVSTEGGAMPKVMAQNPGEYQKSNYWQYWLVLLLVKAIPSAGLRYGQSSNSMTPLISGEIGED